METEIIAGIVIVVVAVCLLVFLTLWSRNRIDNLTKQGFPTARDAKRK